MLNHCQLHCLWMQDYKLPNHHDPSWNGDALNFPSIKTCTVLSYWPVWHIQWWRRYKLDKNWGYPIHRVVVSGWYGFIKCRAMHVGWSSPNGKLDPFPILRCVALPFWGYSCQFGSSSLYLDSQLIRAVQSLWLFISTSPPSKPFIQSW